MLKKSKLIVKWAAENKKTVLVIIIAMIVLVFFFLVLKEADSRSEAEASHSIKKSGGVVLHGCYTAPKGWIKNTNSFFVRVERKRYEDTLCFYDLNPGEVIQLNRINSGDNFYVYTEAGGTIGGMSGTCSTE